MKTTQQSKVLFMAQAAMIAAIYVVLTMLGASFAFGEVQIRFSEAPVPPIIANALIVPFILKYGYAVPLPIPFMMLTVGLGEVISCGVLGMILYTALNKYKGVLFKPSIS